MNYRYRKRTGLVTSLVGAVILVIINIALQQHGVEQQNRNTLQEFVSSKYIQVTDGDTFTIDSRHIRLWGIDAPELHQKCFIDNRETPCGQQAKTSLSDIILSGDVTCRHVATDRYQREVSRCALNGVDIGSQMVRNGWALDYTLYSKGFYKEDEDLARQNAEGIWSLQFDKPSDWRRGIRKSYHKGKAHHP